MTTHAAQRAKGRWHYHADLLSLVPTGDELGYEWQPYFGKRPCEVCNAFAAGDRVICHAYVKPQGGLADPGERLTSQGQPVELSVCVDCLTAWNG